MSIILQKVSEEELVRRIDSAQESVALYAPGSKEAVAGALCRAFYRLSGQVKIVLDVSQKSVDMGYLSPKAVDQLWELQLEFLNGANGHSGVEGPFFHLPGLRIGVLVVDGSAALVYAPFAEKMEDDCLPVVQSCPSGMETTLSELCKEYELLKVIPVDTSMVESFGVPVLKPAKSLSEIRRESEERIRQAEEEKQEAEKRCAEAEKRAEESFKKAVERYKGQFKIRKVELSISSQPASIGRKRITIPAMFLVGIGNEAERNLVANYKLFPDIEEIERAIEREHKGEAISDFVNREKSIREKYLIQVPKFGSYVQSCKEADFKKEIEELKTLGKTVGAHIRKAMSDRVDKALEDLFAILNAQWSNSQDPWVRTYFRENPYDNRSIKEIFMTGMKDGAKGTDMQVAKFVPEVTCFSTPIDESLAKDEAFLNALRPVLRNRNARLPPNEALTIQDLIAIDKDFATQPSLLGESNDRERT